MPKPKASEFQGETLKVATWNLLCSDVDLRERMEEAAAHVLDADIVLVQESRQDEGNVPSSAQVLADQIGMKVASPTNSPSRRPGESHYRYGTAILTKLPIIEEGTVDLRGCNGWQDYASIAWLTAPSGRRILAVSAHLEWGGDKENIRLAQAIAIENEVRVRLAEHARTTSVTPIALLGMDANALPESDTIRYITGLGAGIGFGGAQWVDMWAASGQGSGHTSVVSGNPYAVSTAISVGITRPEMVPDRRIDYLLARGWVYGRPGHPLDVEVRGQSSMLGKVVASDHRAVVATIWDPPIEAE